MTSKRKKPISKMTRDDLKELNIELFFIDKIEAMIGEYLKINEECMQILLPDYDLKMMFSTNNEELIQNISKMTDSPRIKSLLLSAYELYEKEIDGKTKYLNSMTFAILLLYQCGFDDYPLKITYNEKHRSKKSAQSQEIFVMASERLVFFVTTEEHKMLRFSENEYLAILIHIISYKTQGITYYEDNSQLELQHFTRNVFA